MTRGKLPVISGLRDGVIAHCMIDIGMLGPCVPALGIWRSIWRHSMENKLKLNLKLGGQVVIWAQELLVLVLQIFSREDKGDRPTESNSQLQNSGELAQAIELVLNRYLMNAAKIYSVPEPSETISDACYGTWNYPHGLCQCPTAVADFSSHDGCMAWPDDCVNYNPF